MAKKRRRRRVHGSESVIERALAKAAKAASAHGMAWRNGALAYTAHLRLA